MNSTIKLPKLFKNKSQTSNYLIKNYEGIQKIEWHGWYTGTPFFIATSTTVNDDPSTAEDGGLFTYRVGEEQLIESNTDIIIKVEAPVKQEEPNKQLSKEGSIQKVKKSPKGSPTAKIIYNWTEQH